MKEITVKCPRCGKEWNLNYKTAEKKIECPHCHKELCVDPKTLRRLKYIRYLVMVVIACGFAWGMTQFTENNNYLVIIAVLVVALLLMNYIERLDRWLAFMIFNFTYMDLDDYAKVRKPTLGEKLRK